MTPRDDPPRSPEEAAAAESRDPSDAAGEGDSGPDRDGESAGPSFPPGPQALDPRVIHVWRGGLALRTLLYAAMALGLDLWLEPPGPTGLATGTVVIVGLLLVVFLPGLRHRHWRYELRERLVVLRHGLLWRTVSLVPHVRIQHVDTQRGPLERGLGLARLVIHTAAIRGGELEIPGLPVEEAERIRDHLARASGIDDAL